MSVPYYWLSPLEAAAEAGVSLSTITNWRRSGRLKSYRPGGSRIVRIRSDDLLACIEGKPPPSEAEEEESSLELDYEAALRSIQSLLIAASLLRQHVAEKPPD